MPQVRWALALLARHCARAWASARDAAQAAEFPFVGLPTLTDSPEVEGPAAGLAAAFSSAPDAAWLLIAVDMPLLEDATLEALVANREPQAIVTAYRHPDGTPEPLCAVWEPAVRRLLATKGSPSLRRLIEGSAARLLAPADPLWLESVNTAADDAAVRELLGRRGREPPSG
jgi:molybdopterin-guanine dinucleotide biosynthesis protein A